MRKFALLVLVMAMVAVTVLNVNAQDDPYAGVELDGTTIVWWHQYNGGAQLETMDALIAEFNETNEYGITVEGLNQGGYGEIREAMNAAIIAGETPNLVSGFQNDAASYFIDDAALDLNPLIASEWGYSEDELAGKNQAILNANVFPQYDGARLAWPNQVSANVLSVNISMLAELGYEELPSSPEAFVEVACAAAAADDINGYPIKPDASNFESFLAGFGGTIFDAEEGRYNFTSEAAIATLQLYADLYNNDCAYVPDSRFGNTDDFAIGLNPMALGSSAGIPFILGGMADAGYETEWTVTTTPYTEGNQTIQVFVPSVIVVPATPAEEVASWLFIKYLSETEQQIRWTEATSYFPIDLDAAASLTDFEAENPFFAAANALVSSPDVNVYTSPPLLSYGALRGVIGEAVADVTTNGLPVEDVAAELEEAANELYDDLEG